MRKRAWLIGVVLAVTAFFAFCRATGAAPVEPNEGTVTGRVVEFCVVPGLERLASGQTIYRLAVYADAAGPAKGSLDFLSDKAGDRITLYSGEKQSQELFGKKVRAVVELRGDEKSGLFWIKRIEPLD